MLYRKTAEVILIATILTGCSNDAILDKAEEAEGKETKEAPAEVILAEGADNYSIEEVREKNGMQVLEPFKNNESTINRIIETTQQSIFHFYTGAIPPEEFHATLQKHATTDFLLTFGEGEKEQVDTLEAMQMMLAEHEGRVPVDYEVTAPEVEKGEFVARVHRKFTLADQKEAFYLTTLVKEENTWKISNDQPSAPYKIEE